MPAPTNPLVAASDLSDLLGSDVTDAAAALGERMVWGWLQPFLGPDRPEELTDQQFSWAIQLGAIAHENPAGLSSRQVGSVSEQYSAEARQAILDAVESSVSGGNPGSPRGRFPRPKAYPDPAERC